MLLSAALLVKRLRTASPASASRAKRSLTNAANAIWACLKPFLLCVSSGSQKRGNCQGSLICKKVLNGVVSKWGPSSLAVFLLFPLQPIQKGALKQDTPKCHLKLIDASTFTHPASLEPPSRCLKIGLRGNFSDSACWER